MNMLVSGETKRDSSLSVDFGKYNLPQASSQLSPAPMSPNAAVQVYLNTFTGIQVL